MGYRLTVTPQLVRDANQHASDPARIAVHAYAILLHSRPIIPISDDLQRESSSSDITPANAFMEILHDAGTLIPTHTSEHWMGITMAEQLAIYKGYFLAFLLIIFIPDPIGHHVGERPFCVQHFVGEANPQ